MAMMARRSARGWNGVVARQLNTRGVGVSGVESAREDFLAARRTREHRGSEPPLPNDRRAPNNRLAPGEREDAAAHSDCLIWHNTPKDIQPAPTGEPRPSPTQNHEQNKSTEPAANEGCGDARALVQVPIWHGMGRGGVHDEFILIIVTTHSFK